MLKQAVIAVAALVGLSANAQMSIPGSFSTNPSGAATYTIAIHAPPGLAGIEPNVAVSYSSQAHNGAMGVGWNLSGLSTIERCPETVFQDGVRTAVSYSATDRFCLAGQRLVLVTGTYGADGSTYATELESFTKITLKGSTNGGPTWFLVQSPSGQTTEYGNTVDSRIEVTDAVPSTRPYRAWALSKTYDAMGNYLTVSYVKDKSAGVFNGGYYPGVIAYGGNSNRALTPSASVTFDFDLGTRPDIAKVWQGGYPVTRRGRLKSITTSSSGVDVLKYAFTYEQSPGTALSRLKNISACKPGGACLAPTSVNYTQDSTTLPFTQLAQSGIGTDDQTKWNAYTWLVLDVDGDGRNDLMRFPYGSVDTGAIILSNGDGTFAAGQSFTNPAPIISNIGGPSIVKMAVDINGDGLPDIAFFPQGGKQFTWISLGGRRPILFSQPQFFQENVPTNASSVPVNAFDFAPNDVDSNGIADLTGVQTNSDYNLYFDANTKSYHGFGGRITDTDVAQTGGSLSIDLDGDGQFDRFYPMKTDDGRVREWILPYWKPAGVSTTARYATVDQGTDKDLKLSVGQWLRADVNGDGLTDLIHVNTDVKKVYTWISKGNGDFIVVPNSNSLDSTDLSTGTWQVVDFNGDGLADLVHADGKVNAKLWKSDGMGNFTVSTLPNTADLCKTSCIKWLSAGLRGDGVVDLIHFSDYENRFTVWSMPRVFVDTPTSIDDGVGNSYKWQSDFVANIRGKALGTTSGSYTDYQPYADTATFDASSNQPIFPNGNHLGKLLAPVSVVVRADLPNGLAGTQTLSYDYGPMMVDIAYHGFAGMQWVQQTNQSTGFSSRTTFSQAFPYAGMPTKVEHGTSATTYSDLGTTTNTLACLRASSKTATGVARACSTTYPSDDYGQRYFPFVPQSQTSATDFDGTNFWPMPGSRSTVAAADIDTYGNRLKSTSVVLNADGSDSVYSTTTTGSFSNDTTNWRLGRPLLMTVTATGPALPASVTPGSLVPQTGAHALLTSLATQDYGAAWQGAVASSQSWTYQNDGTAPMTLVTPTLVAPLSVSSNTCANVPAGSSCTIVVRDDNSVAGLNQTQAFAPSGALNTPGAATATYSVKSSIPRWSQTSVAFGTVNIGGSGTANVTLFNDGNTAQNWSTYAVTGPVNLNMSACASVGPGSSCAVTVTFRPTANGPYSSAALQPGNAFPTYSNTLTVTGTGATPPATATAALAWGNQKFGSATAQTATITNNTAAAIAMTVPSAASVTGAGFAFQSTTCTASLAGNASCTVTLTFTPTAFHGYSGSLEFHGTQLWTTTTLSGSGAQAQLVFSPTSYDFGNVSTNVTAQASTTISNTGNLPASQTIANTNGSLTNGCTASLLPGTSCTVTVNWSPSVVGASSGSVTASSANGPTLSAFNWTGTGVAPAVTLTSALAFGNVLVGQPSATQVATLTNASAGPVTVTAPVNGSPNIGAPYSLVSTTCGGVLAAGASCTMTVRYAPSTMGAAPGTLTVLTGTAQWLSTNLTGTGIGSSATLTSTATQAFPAAWQDAASATLSWNYRNDGTAPMTLASPALAAPLSVSSNNCSAIAAGASCTISVLDNNGVAGLNKSQSFTPTGALSAPAAATATYSVKTAIPRWAQTSLAMGSVNVGASAVNTVALYNDGNSAQDWSAYAASGQVALNMSGCGNVAAGGSCTVTITYRPTVNGAFASATLIPTPYVPTYSNALTVTGTGLTAPTSTAALAWGNQKFGTATTRTATFTNNAPIAATMTVPSAASVSGAGFAFQSTTCAGSLAANASCTVTLTFTPSAFSAYSGTLALASSQGSTTTALSGSGAQAQLVFSPATYSFGNVPSNVSTQATFTMTNTGNVAAGWALGGSASQLDASLCVGPLSPGASCTLKVGVGPTGTLGAFSGTVTGSTVDGPTLNSFNFAGTFITPVVTLTSSLDFGSVTLGQSSPTQVSTLTNASPGPIAVTAPINGSPNIAAPYRLVGTTCGGTLAASASCTMTVLYAPTTAGANPGVLNIYENSTWISTNLVGTGVAPAIVPFTMTTSTGLSTTFANPNSTAVTPTASGVNTTNGGGVNVTTNTCTGSVGAGTTCTITFTAAISDCKADNYTAQAYVTDQAGTAFGSTVSRTSSRTICN